jgi:hypothetical protein
LGVEWNSTDLERWCLGGFTCTLTALNLRNSLVFLQEPLIHETHEAGAHESATDHQQGLGKRSAAAPGWRECLMSVWRLALAIALIYGENAWGGGWSAVSPEKHCGRLLSVLLAELDCPPASSRCRCCSTTRSPAAHCIAALLRTNDPPTPMRPWTPPLRDASGDNRHLSWCLG